MNVDNMVSGGEIKDEQVDYIYGVLKGMGKGA